jgi:response regulator RpfG family c-di-GMP phosphodiesterase
MSQPNILLVDDEEHVLNALRRVLRKENYNLILCDNPFEALEK